MEVLMLRNYIVSAVYINNEHNSYTFFVKTLVPLVQSKLFYRYLI